MASREEILADFQVGFRYTVSPPEIPLHHSSFVLGLHRHRGRGGRHLPAGGVGMGAGGE